MLHLDYCRSQCSEFRNGASASAAELCIGPKEGWGTPCYPLNNNGQCNGDWNYCSIYFCNFHFVNAFFWLKKRQIRRRGITTFKGWLLFTPPFAHLGTI